MSTLRYLALKGYFYVNITLLGVIGCISMSTLRYLQLLGVLLCQHYVTCSYWVYCYVNITLLRCIAMSTLRYLQLLGVLLCQHYVTTVYCYVNITLLWVIGCIAMSTLRYFEWLGVLLCQHYVTWSYWVYCYVNITLLAVIGCIAMSTLRYLELLGVEEGNMVLKYCWTWNSIVYLEVTLVLIWGSYSFVYFSHTVYNYEKYDKSPFSWNVDGHLAYIILSPKGFSLLLFVRYRKGSV